MSDDRRTHLASLEYWRTPPERVPQRFYVAFCLLMSSIQDWVLGLKERESQNLNWSATCSYYSLVHGGRLLCFLALGDFPTSHSQLRSVLAQGSQPTRNRRGGVDGYPFNWLRDFITLTGGRRQLQPPGGQAESLRQMITDYLEETCVSEARQRLERFGTVLAAAGPLRNDSNYEALLIAHEYQHVTMSSAFDRLSRYMASAAESAVPFFVDAFNGFRHRDPDLPGNHDTYEAFLHNYAHGRIGDAIRRKVGQSSALGKRLDEFLMRLETRPTGVSYDHLEEQVSMTVFGNKAGLMRAFEGRIEDLRNATRE